MRNEKWNTFEDIQRILKSPKDGKWESGGPILYYKNKTPYYFDGEGHTLILGRTGVGKSYCGTKTLLGTLAKANESFLVADPKGELYKTIVPMLSKDYNIKVLDFRDMINSAGYNPLIYAYRLYTSGIAEKIKNSMEIIDEMATAFYPIEKTNDVFWPLSARTIFKAVAELLFVNAKSEDEVNLYNIYKIVMSGSEKFGSCSTYLKEFTNLEPETSMARMNLQNFVEAPRDTAGGMACTFFQGLSSYVSNVTIVSMLSNDDFKMEKLDGESPTAIFVVLPDETPIYNSICGTILSQITRHYIKMAEEQYGGSLPRRLNIVIDELASFAPSIPNLSHLMAASRSRNIRITAVLQAISQLNDVYDESRSDTILSNFSTTISFSTNNWATLEELSRRCGERQTKTGHIEPLITPVQLGAMVTGQALVVINNRYKYITQLPNFNELFGNEDIKKSPNNMPQYTRKPLKAFDLKENVKERKKTTLLDILDDGPQMSPFDIFAGSSPSSNQPTNESDIDDLVKRIDAKIAEIEEAERKEREKQSKASRTKRECWVNVDKGNCDPRKLARLIMDNTDINNIEQCIEAVNNLPVRIQFDNKKEAEQFIRVIKTHGGIATLDK